MAEHKSPHKLVGGETYYFEGRNKNWVGRVVEGTIDNVRKEVGLTEASWVADSGRFGKFIREGKTENMEIEYVGDVVCQFSDFIPFPHKLFKEDV